VEGMTFMGMRYTQHIKKVKNKNNCGLMGLKDSKLLRKYQKCNHTLVHFIT
jgi:hypothetical protein